MSRYFQFSVNDKTFGIMIIECFRVSKLFCSASPENPNDLWQFRQRVKFFNILILSEMYIIQWKLKAFIKIFHISIMVKYMFLRQWCFMISKREIKIKYTCQNLVRIHSIWYLRFILNISNWVNTTYLYLIWFFKIK